MGNKPKQTFKLGSVTASIFVNQTEKGSFETVTVERRYKQGDEWRSSNSYTTEQLAHGIAVMQLALQALARDSDQR